MSTWTCQHGNLSTHRAPGQGTALGCSGQTQPTRQELRLMLYSEGCKKNKNRNKNMKQRLEVSHKAHTISCLSLYRNFADCWPKALITSNSIWQGTRPWKLVRNAGPLTHPRDSESEHVFWQEPLVICEHTEVWETSSFLGLVVKGQALELDYVKTSCRFLDEWLGKSCLFKTCFLVSEMK